MLEEFRSEGIVETKGHFKLDESAAREKLQQFRLKDPHAWVLEFVRAAQLGGVADIFFSFTASLWRCEIPGLEVPVEMARDWVQAPFAPLNTKEARVMRYLSIGLGTIQGLKPKKIRFETGGREDRLALEISGESETEVKPEFMIGTLIEVEGRTWHGVSRFFEQLFGNLAEVTHLKESCRFAKVRVTVDKEAINREPFPDLRRRVPITSPREDGVLVLNDGQGKQLWLQQHGVKIEEVQEPSYHPWDAFGAVVESLSVKTDLGASKVVRDQHFNQVMSLVGMAWARAVVQRLDETPEHEWSGFVKVALKRIALSKEQNQTITPSYELLWDRIKDIPVWPALVGPEQKKRLISTYELASVPGKRLNYVTQDWPIGMIREDEILLRAGFKQGVNSSGQRYDGVFVGETAIQTIELLVDKKHYSYQSVIQGREEFHLNKSRWKQSPVEDARLSRVQVQSKLELEFEGSGKWVIDLGFGHGIGGTQAVCIKEGRLLSRTRDAQGPDVAIMIQGELPPDQSFRRLDPNHKNVHALVQTLAFETAKLAQRVLYAPSPDGVERPLLNKIARDVLVQMLAGELTNSIVKGLGLSELVGRSFNHSAPVSVGTDASMLPEQKIALIRPHITSVLLFRFGSRWKSLEQILQSTAPHKYIIYTENQFIHHVVEDALYLTPMDFRALIPLLLDTLVEYQPEEAQPRPRAESPRPRSVPKPAPKPVEEPSHRGEDPYTDRVVAWLLGVCQSVFGEANLRGMRTFEGNGKQVARLRYDRVELDTKHPVVAASMARPDDQILMQMVASSVYTVVNQELEVVTDQHEFNFVSTLVHGCAAHLPPS